MRVINLIFWLLVLSVLSLAQDVVKTRKGGGVRATDYQMTQPFCEIGSANMPKFIDGISA